MAQTLQVDSQWVVEELTNIGKAVAVLPSMEKHLARINATIKEHEKRITVVEGSRKSWKTAATGVWRVLEALLIAALLFGFQLR